jgi:hypothetical protein
VALSIISTRQVLTASRLLTLFPAFTGKAPALEPCLLLPRRPRQRPFAPFSHNAGMASSSVDALAAIASNTCSLSYCRSASYMRVGDLSGKHGRPAVTSSRMLFALCLLHIQLERLGHYSFRGRHPACWARHRDGCGGLSRLW